jgi:hypothetical protein
MVLMKIARRAQFTASRQPSRNVTPLKREKRLSSRAVSLLEGLQNQSQGLEKGEERKKTGT